MTACHTCVTRRVEKWRARPTFALRASVRLMAEPAVARLRYPRAEAGAPGRTRTCDPRLRSSAKGGNRGQR